MDDLNIITLKSVFYHLCANQYFFFISVEKYLMLQKFKGLAYVILVKSILSDSPIIQRYESSELSSFEKTIEVLKLKK